MLNRWQQMRQSRVALLVLMSIAMPVAFNVWSALLNNFVVERAAFTGIEIGILQSLREVPGFLAFTAIFVLLIIREQTFALLALVFLGAGVSLTGFFPSEYGLYFTKCRSMSKFLCLIFMMEHTKMHNSACMSFLLHLPIAALI